MHGFYINLSKRTDRNERMKERLKATSHQIERLEAVDADSIKTIPGIFLKGTEDGPYKRAAYATILSHTKAIEEARKRGWKEVMVMEDDALLCPDFDARLELFMKQVPGNWHCLWLGFFPHTDPVAVSQSVVRLVRSFGAFGYIIRSSAYHYITKARHYHAIDNIMADRLQPVGRCYGTIPFLVGVEEGWSDISGRFRELGNINQHFVA